MRVDPARAAGHVEHQETTYYFCSKGCVAKFSADPERYLRPPERESHPEHSGGASASSSALGTEAPGESGNVPAPMLQIGGLKKLSPHPAPSPPPSTPHPAPGTIYTCPMHPEITSNDPDAHCPKCGMKLQPRRDGAQP